MDYQKKKINLLDNKATQPSRYKTNIYVKIIDDVEYIAPINKLDLKLQC